MKETNTHYIKSTPNLFSDLIYFCGWLIIAAATVFFILTGEWIVFIWYLVAYGLFQVSHKVQTKTLTPWDEDPVSEWPVHEQYKPLYSKLIHLKNNTINAFEGNHMGVQKLGKYNVGIVVGNYNVTLKVSYNDLHVLDIKIGKSISESSFYLYKEPLFFITVADKVAMEFHSHKGEIHYKVREQALLTEDKIKKLSETVVLEVLESFIKVVDEGLEKRIKRKQLKDEQLSNVIDEILEQN